MKHLTKEVLVEELKKRNKPGLDVEAEANHVIELLRREELKTLREGYAYVGFINAGGSGMVFKVTDLKSKGDRALKLSRVHSVAGVVGAKNPVNVELEIQALALVAHQNITRFYEGIALPDGHYYIVTQLVDKPSSIDEWLSERIKVSGKPTTDREISDTLRQLAEKLLGYANALAYMHGTHQLYHMDIKPPNLLISGDGTPFVTDLGFARWKKRYQDDEDVPVGFTYSYNHPDLVRQGFGIPSTLARSRNMLKGGELSPKFDLFAFGRTILFLLRIFEKRYEDRGRPDYVFLFLHLLGTLSLDGKNTAAPSRLVKN